MIQCISPPSQFKIVAQCIAFLSGKIFLRRNLTVQAQKDKTKKGFYATKFSSNNPHYLDVINMSMSTT